MKGEKDVECRNCSNLYHGNCVGIKSGFKLLTLINIFFICDLCLVDVKSKLNSKGLCSSEKSLEDDVKSNAPVGNEEIVKQPQPPKAENFSKSKTMISEVGSDCGNILIAGDSMIRHYGSGIEENTRLRTTTVCKPGKGINEVSSDLEKNIVCHKYTLLSVGGNDIGKFGSIELRSKYRKLLDIIKSRQNKCIILGVLPRLRENNEWHSRVIALNSWLHRECLKDGFVFVDLWKEFIGQRKLYGNDGVHLSHRGVDLVVDRTSELLSHLEGESFL